MQTYNVWPGAYEFTSEIRTILFEIKKYFDKVLEKIDEMDKKVA